MTKGPQTFLYLICVVVIRTPTNVKRVSNISYISRVHVYLTPRMQAGTC